MNYTVGPSALYHGVEDFFVQALHKGYGSLSHRSDTFSELSKEGLNAFRAFFRIPDDYKIYYTYSATESLEISLRALATKQSTHVVNGNFGKMWSNLAKKNGHMVQILSSPLCSRVPVEEILSTENMGNMLCITANETSTGVQYSPTEISQISKQMPKETLLAVDCTSSMGSIAYDFSAADVWAFSVQKAFGLPAGLGIVMLSPRAFSCAMHNEENGHEAGNHHSLSALEKKMNNTFQTPTTPNVLGIFSFGYICKQFTKDFGSIEHLQQQTEKKANRYYNFFETHPLFHPAVSEPSYRSSTIIVVESSEKNIQKQKEKLAQHGIVVGGGYGPAKPTQMRIANFPVHSGKDVEQLIEQFPIL